MTDLRQMLTADQLLTLRQKGLLSEQEVAFVTGDLLIAEDAVTNERRVIGEASLLNESNRRVLKG